MKPTTKIIMALSALLSINALALFDGVARSVNNTTSALTRTPARPMTGKPAPQTQQSTYVPQQGVNTYANQPAGYGMKPMPNKPGFNRRPLMGQNANPGYGRKPAFFNNNNQPTNTSGINQRYVGSSEFEKSRMPQDTHPANVPYTSDDVL
jgi:hypothetical protein